jgi:hypothetical protein
MGDQSSCRTAMLIDLKHKSNDEIKWVLTVLEISGGPAVRRIALITKQLPSRLAGIFLRKIDTIDCLDLEIFSQTCNIRG